MYLKKSEIEPENCSARAARQKIHRPSGLTTFLDTRWVVSLNITPLLLKPKSELEAIRPGVIAFTVSRSPFTATVCTMVWDRKPSQLLCARITSLPVLFRKAEHLSG